MFKLNQSRPQWLTWPYLILIHVVLWWLVTSLFNRGLDNYGDMAENYAWAQSIDWGTFKHPPLVAWVVHAWFAFMPTTTWSYYLLSWVNVALTLWGISALSQLFATNPSLSNAPLRRLEEVQNIQWVAVALGSLLLPLSTLAGKYNANAVLLPLWPWATVFLLKSWLDTGWRGLLNTALLALLAALSMLGKYYSGVLLLGFFIASLLHADGRRWYRTIKPYLAVVLFLLLLTPHFLWVQAHDYITFKYAEEQGDGGVSFKHIFSFALSYYYYALLLWGVAFWYFLRPNSAGQSKIKAWLGFFRYTLPKPTDGVLCLTFALAPMLISVLFALSGFVELTAHWAIPIWYALPVLAIAKREKLIDAALLTRLWRVMLCVWTLVLVVGAARGLSSNTALGKTSVPREELAHAVMKEYGNSKIAWVGGIWQEAASLTFYMDGQNLNHPRAVPMTPDSPEALINPLNHWQETDGLMVCTLLPAPYASPDEYAKCQANIESWFNAHQQAIDKKVLTLPASTWVGQSSKALTATIYHYHARN